MQSGRGLTDLRFKLLFNLPLRPNKVSLSASEPEEDVDLIPISITFPSVSRLVSSLEPRRNIVGSMHPARMTDIMTRKAADDNRADVRGKRETRPLEENQVLRIRWRYQPYRMP